MALGTFSNSGLGFGVAYTLYDYFTHTSYKIQRSMNALDAGTTRLAHNIERNMTRARIGVGFLLTAVAGLAAYVRGARIDAHFQQMQIGLETFVGSAQRAEMVMNQIRKDAIDNPVFKYQKMFEANMMMISQGVDPGQSRRIIKNLTTILLAAGRGNEELARMGINLQQLAAGAFTMRDVREFGYAGVNLRAIFKEFMGLDLDKMGGTALTVDLIDKAFQKATASGTKYGQMLARVMETVQGRLMMVEEQLTFTFEALGQSIREQVTLPLLEGLSNVLVKMQEFLKSPVGQWVARMTFYVLVLTAGLSALALVVLGVKIGLSSLGLSMLIHNTAVKQGIGLMAQWRVATILGMSTGAKFKGTVLMGLTHQFGLLSSRITASSLAITGFFRRVRLAIPALMRTLSPFILIGGALMVVNKALTAFNRFSEDTGMAPGTGFTGWLQRTGALLKWVTTLFTSYEKTQKGMFTVPTAMTDAFKRMGILDNMLRLATWVARIIELWRGFKQGMKESLQATWQWLKKILFPLLQIDTTVSESIGTLAAWREAGERLGKALSIVFKALIGYMVLMVVWQGLMAVAAVINAVAMMAAYWPVYLTLGLIVGALVAIWAWSGDTSSKYDSSLASMYDSTDTWLGKVAGINTEPIGKTMGDQIVDGMSQALEQWDIEAQLKDLVKKATKSLWRVFLKKSVAPVLEQMPFTAPLSAYVGSDGRYRPGLWGLSHHHFGGAGIPSFLTDGAVKPNRPPTSSVVTPATSMVIPAPVGYNSERASQRPVIHVHNHMDGKEISSYVIENYQWLMGTSHSGE